MSEEANDKINGNSYATTVVRPNGNGWTAQISRTIEESGQPTKTISNLVEVGSISGLLSLWSARRQGSG